jgi:hypothetical protein
MAHAHAHAYAHALQLLLQNDSSMGTEEEVVLHVSTRTRARV